MRQRFRADPKQKELIKEMLQRMSLGVLPPRFCKYTDREGIIEFAVICHILKATSEIERARVADAVKQLHAQNYFEYPKAWVTETSEEDGVEISYTYPPKLLTRTQ